ncbi:unnamed protein product [Caenorhabditis nigoni]
MNYNEDDYDLDDLLIPKKRMRMEKEPSPYSNTDRKSLCESIEQKLLTGELKEKKLDDNFTEIYDSVKVCKMRCSKCRKLVSIGPGSHKTHHKRGLCTETSKQPKKPILGRQQKSLNECIVRYMMENGSSFHQLESSPFRKLIHRVVNVVSPDIDTSNMRLPSGEWIRGQLEQRYDDLLKEISLEILNPVRQEEACLVIDYGKKWNDFLSAFLVYISRTTDEPKLKVIPFAFSPIFVAKTTENTVELLVEAGSKFGIQKDELLKLRVVGDGAANIQKIGKFFKSCNVCSCHAIQKSAERVLDPLKDSRKHLDSDEQKHLDVISMRIEICANISSRIRRIKTVQYIKNERKNLQVGNQSLQSFKNNFIDDFYDDPSPVPDSEREIEDYEKMSVSTEERNLCPLIFWNRHNGRYPKLSKLSNSIFCVLSSESLCERAFSHLNRVFRPDRYNMEPVMIEKIMLSYMYLNNYT